MVAGDRSKRIRCAYTARQLVNTYDLDGIDSTPVLSAPLRRVHILTFRTVHWENLIEQHICNSYLQLLAEMRAYLPPSHYLLTSALSADPWTLRNLDLQTASMFLDLINLRSYDFAGPWTRAAGHASQIYMPPVTTYANEHCMTVLSALRHYIEESKVPPSKILLGIPVFGRSFLGATRAGDSYLADGGVFPYSGLPRPHSIEEYDAQAQAAYCVGGDGGFVTYDVRLSLSSYGAGPCLRLTCLQNPSSVCHKAELVKNNRLAGLYFTDGTADHSGHRSIIQAGFLHLAPGD